MTDLPILYSFRRCPYAMRGRMGLWAAGIKVTLRELILRDKPEEMLAASPKGSVPVLVLPDGKVVDESLDVMLWALRQNDPGSWLPNDETFTETRALIEDNDGPFKHHLDRYKYASRYEGTDAMEHRDGGVQFLEKLDARSRAEGQLFGPTPTLADIAIFPFVRQFRIADKDWFDAQDWPGLHPWLQGHMASDLFASVMKKYDLWKETGTEYIFGRA